MNKAACYIRVSTDDQLEYSPDSQLEKIREYCARNGFALSRDNIFIEEEGVSGRKASRRLEFQRMIAKAKSKPKPFDVIIVWKFSRFARNREDSIVYKSMLKKSGIDVVSVTENVGDDKMSVITEAIIEAMDEYYSLNLAEEVRRGMTERVKHGRHNSVAPFGYRIVDKELVIVPEQAEIIREVYARYLNGWGHKQIAVWLNALGVTTRRGGRIENRTVKYWLQNPVYHGYVRWNPTERASSKHYINTPDTIVVKGRHEPIIDSETWESAQKRYEETRAGYPEYRRGNTSKEYALSGIVKCSCCGATLGVTCGRKYLQCVNYAHGLCTSSHHASYEMIWLMLLSAIENDLKSGVFQLELRARPVTADDTKALNAQIERTKMKLKRIREAFEAGVDSIDEYQNSKARITAELETLKSKLETVCRTKIKPEEKMIFADKYLNALEILKDPQTTEHEKNLLLREFVKRATYFKADNSLSVTYKATPHNYCRTIVQSDFS